jgi:hypothetical protein
VNSGWQTLQGPTGNAVFGAGTTANYCSWAAWRDHIYCTIDEFSTPRKIYRDGSGNLQVRNAGLPALASSPTITKSHTEGTSYVYFLHYYYEYTVGTVTHVDRGPVTQIQVTNGPDYTAGVGRSMSFASIPVLANSTTECHATAAIKVKIYRTVNGGSVGKYVGEVTNGTTTFVDSVADSGLGAAIYTNGGVVECDPAPQAKFLVIANDIGWYGYVKEGSEQKSFRVRQSLQGDIDSSPEDFITDVDGEITGMGAVGIYPIVFQQNRMYRLEGYVDNLGRGSVRKRIISDRVGTVSHNSIISTIKGLYFAALDGFYFTDGFSVQKLTEHLNESYGVIVSTSTRRRRIYGAIDATNNLCFWACQRDDANSDNDSILVLDAYWGVKSESCFTAWSSGGDMKPTCLAFVSGVLYRGDTRGYVFKHPSDELNDPVVDTTTAPANWVDKQIIYDYVSCAFAMGSELLRKYVTQLVVVGKNETNLSVDVQSCNDDSQSWRSLKEIRYRDNITWEDEDVVWGDDGLIWDRSGSAIFLRSFAAGGLRCTYKQVRFTNAFTTIFRSDDYSQATVDAAGETAQLTDVAEEWPSIVVGYSIYFSVDNYTRGYEILARTDDTLTIDDPDGTLVNGDHKWIIKGYRINELFHIEAYTIVYDVIGESLTGYSKAEAGGNA